MIRIKQVTYYFCILFLAVFSLLAESKEKAGSSEYQALWDNGYGIKKDYQKSWSDISEYETKLINLLGQYEFEKGNYQFGSALEYAVEAGSLDVFEAFLKYGLTHAETDKQLSFVVHNYNYGKQNNSHSGDLLAKYELLIKRILNLSYYDSHKTIVGDTFVKLIKGASVSLINFFGKYELSQTVIDRALDECISLMRYDFSRTVADDVAGKVNILMEMTARPSGEKFVEAVLVAKEREKYYVVIPELFKHLDQKVFDVVQSEVMEFVKTDNSIRESIHENGLLIKSGGRDVTPFTSVWRESRDNEWQDWFVFVASHYQGDGQLQDKQTIREALGSGIDHVMKAVASVKGAEEVFAELLPVHLNDLARSGSQGDLLSYQQEKAVAQAIIGSSLPLDITGQLEEILALGDSELTHGLIARLSVDELTEQQGILLRFIADNSLKKALHNRIFKFSASSGTLQAILSQFEENASDENREQLSFVLHHYEFTGSEGDLSVITRLHQLAPELTRDALVGALGISVQQMAGTVFLESLRSFKTSHAMSMIDSIDDLKHVPAPEGGFEAFICKMADIKEYPENPLRGFAVVLRWLQSANYELDTNLLQGCAFGSRRQVARMPLAQFSFVFALLYRYRWTVDVTVASHIKARVLNHVEEIMERMDKEAEYGPISELFALTRWLEAQVDGGVAVSARDISLGTDLRWITFKGWENTGSMELFVDHLLSLYPDETYKKYLKMIYRSENIELLSYVLSNPGHLEQLQYHVDDLLKSYMGDFEEPELQLRTSLLLMHCVVPRHSEHPAVIAAIQHCEMTSKKSAGEMFSQGTHSFCNVDEPCQLVLEAPLDNSIKSILNRKFFSKPDLPE